MGGFARQINTSLCELFISIKNGILASQCDSADANFPEINPFPVQSDTPGVRCAT
jgi:hypothetical protein